MNALLVKCPSCGVDAGKQCVTHDGAALLSVKKRGKTKKDRDKVVSAAMMRAPHASRIEAAERGQSHNRN